MIEKNNQASLDRIKADILQKNICPDLAKTANQLVFGEGDSSANIVFVGEAPGKNEDLQGVPFVGAAGKFLDELLKSIHLNRQDVYITNIVKYRPPGNRDPLPEEKDAFLPFLYKQLMVINPKLVITLGRHSTNCFLPDVQISHIHGQTKLLNGRLYMPLYHPAAALYNGSLRQTLFEDFAKIPDILKTIN